MTRTVRSLRLGAKILLVLAASGLSAEGLLRVGSAAVPPAIGNLIYTRYGAFADGIYFLEPISRMYAMRKRFFTRNYMNGYWWTHETDDYGFRNPGSIASRDLLLLGDSLIYGHGVEERDSVRAQLSNNFGITAYNMGRQGDCLYNEYVLLRAFLPVFRPRHVVLFPFLNDFSDLLSYRTDSELASIPEFDYDYDSVRASLLGPEPEYPLPLTLANKTYTYAAVRNASRIVDAVAENPSHSDAGEQILRPFLDSSNNVGVLIDYTRRVLSDMRTRCDTAGTRLHVVFIRPSRGSSNALTNKAADRMGAILSRLCTELSIPFRDTRGTLDADDLHYLPSDGHLSPKGNRALAGIVADALATRTQPSPSQ